jgi:isopentenyl-diphosphate delta-isomerase
MKEEQVILVNERDEAIGLMPKLEAHQKAVLHRAFSVFVLNDKNEIMLQQRAPEIPFSAIVDQHLLQPPTRGRKQY